MTYGILFDTVCVTDLVQGSEKIILESFFTIFIYQAWIFEALLEIGSSLKLNHHFEF